MIKKISAVVFFASLLAACSGGGGKSPAPVAEDLIKIPSQVFSFDENAQNSILISSEINDLVLEITEMHPSGFGSVILNGDRIEITLKDLDRPSRISFVIYSKGKGIDDASAKKISVVAINSSGAGIEEQGRNLQTQSDDLLNLKEDKSIFQFVLETTYLNSLIDHNEKLALMSGFAPQDSAAHGSLQIEINDLNSAMALYEKGNLSDIDLQKAITDVSQVLSSHGDYAAQKLSEILIYSDPFFSDLIHTTLSYDAQSGRYSRYLGQSTMGSYTEGTWAFNENYHLLSTLVTTHLSDPILICEDQ